MTAFNAPTHTTMFVKVMLQRSLEPDEMLQNSIFGWQGMAMHVQVYTPFPSSMSPIHSDHVMFKSIQLHSGTIHPPSHWHTITMNQMSIDLQSSNNQTTFIQIVPSMTYAS